MAETWDTYLQPGERLLWEGAPLPGIHGKAGIIGLGFFGLPFLAFGVAAFGFGLKMLSSLLSVNDAGLGLFLMAFSIPFMGIGGYLVFGQWVVAAQAHRRIRYALSTRAAYVATTWRSRKLEIYPILRDTATGLEKGRASDTVWFHIRTEKDSEGDRSTTRIAFENIADGEKVFRLIRSIQMGTA